MTSPEKPTNGSPEKTIGQPATSGHKRHYAESDVQAVKAARHKLRISGVEIGVMHSSDLALNALTTKSEMHRMACVIELLVRISGTRDVQKVIDQIPTVKRKDDRNKIHAVQLRAQDSDHKADVA